MVVHLPLFSEAECEGYWASVLALKKYWTHRHDYLPSHTLGAAAYLDVPRHGLATYMVRSVRMNRFLRRDFASLLDGVAGCLSEHLGAPTVITPRFAVPGFHVFEHHPRMAELKPRIHFDLQGFRLDFDQDDAADPDKRLSFTVPICMPEDGAGLHVWPIHYDSTEGQTNAEAKAAYDKVEPAYHAYSLGELLVHDGSHLHAIATGHTVQPGETRVTFQGHGQQTGGVWHLYW